MDAIEGERSTFAGLTYKSFEAIDKKLTELNAMQGLVARAETSVRRSTMLLHRGCRLRLRRDRRATSSRATASIRRLGVVAVPLGGAEQAADLAALRVDEERRRQADGPQLVALRAVGSA